MFDMLAGQLVKPDIAEQSSPESAVAKSPRRETHSLPAPQHGRRQIPASPDRNDNRRRIAIELRYPSSPKYDGVMTTSHEHVTRLMASAADGDAAAVEELLPLVYAQLRAAAQRCLAGEAPGHTLQATALVHEAYIKLAGPREIAWQNRGHFYAAAAQAMRRILVDHARARGARGGRGVRLSALPDVQALAAGDPEQILAVDRALTRLESDDPEAAALVRLRFFGGLSVDHAAMALGISPRSAARLWKYARASLHRMLEGDCEV
jgi:RNA polymerase sigma factor (TIGR02999 family)